MKTSSASSSSAVADLRRRVFFAEQAAATKSHGSPVLAPPGADRVVSNHEDEDAVTPTPTPTPAAASLWFIHGRAYDLTNFMDQHPGGKDALELGRGRDCTALFESYHPFTEKPRALLPKFLVPGNITPPEDAVAEEGAFLVPDPAAPPADAAAAAPLVRDPFWEDLRRNCKARLEGEDLAMPWPHFVFGLAMIALEVYIYLYFFLAGSVPSAFALGFVAWLVTGTFGHEGLHYGISRRHPWLNLTLGFFSIGPMANPILWQHQHTYGHHSHTNDHAKDPDTHHFENMLRMHRLNPHNKLHRFLVHRVWVYLWWSQTVYGEALLLPLKALVTGRIQGATSLAPLDWKKRAGIALHTVIYLGLFWLAPYLCMRQAKIAALGLAPAEAPLIFWDLVGRNGYLFHGFTSTIGLLFGVFSQCTHLTIHSMQAAAKPGMTWARLQVETAANFCENSVMWNVLSGGLNLQIEHHLFPGLNHGVLRKLTPVIRATCEAHGVTFRSYRTFPELLTAVHAYFASLATPLAVGEE